MDRLVGVASIAFLALCFALTFYSLYRVGTKKPFHWSLKVLSVLLSAFTYFVVISMVMSWSGQLNVQSMSSVGRNTFTCMLIHALFMAWGGQIFAGKDAKNGKQGAQSDPNTETGPGARKVSLVIVELQGADGSPDSSQRALRVRARLAEQLPGVEVRVVLPSEASSSGNPHEFNLKTDSSSESEHKRIEEIVRSTIRTAA